MDQKEKEKFLKWDFVDAIDPNNKQELDLLENKMGEFYNQAALNHNYWEQTNKNQDWKPETHPYHCHLQNLIKEGETVIDFGCGAAHSYNNLQEKNIDYIGIEWSKKQVSINQEKYPKAKFICGNINQDNSLENLADWAVSFFVLEHCVRPNLFLTKMYQSLKKGGKIGLICPNFKDGMNSIRTGFRATSKKEKINRFQLLDVIVSLYQEKKVIPQRIKSIHHSEMQFPIYLKPRCLNAPYYSDNDAVYLVRENKVADYLQQLGMKIIYNSRDIEKNQSESIILYLIAEKI
jgi:ubiquinone/menaquinone biosynthesis C-methylase UbiE